jgi:hypothetical protein
MRPSDLYNRLRFANARDMEPVEDALVLRV